MLTDFGQVKDRDWPRAQVVFVRKDDAAQRIGVLGTLQGERKSEKCPNRDNNLSLCQRFCPHGQNGTGIDGAGFHRIKLGSLKG
jgi:hypothetical protein